MKAVHAPAAVPTAAVPTSRETMRRYSTVQIPAVRRAATEPPRSSGRMLDDELGFDFHLDIDADGALALDCLPSSHRTRVEPPRQMSNEAPSESRATPPSRPAMRAMLPPSPPWPVVSAGPRRASSPQAATDTHAALVAFAGFGAPPAGILGTPAYALRVTMRRRSLNADLARARLCRSQDVSLYEASLRTADDGAVRTGVVLAASMITLGFLLVAGVLHLARSLG